MEIMVARELKSKWNKEQEAYKKQEVGSGVQIFVKDILQSQEIFNLKKGLKSTKPEKRKNEFLEEELTKAQRQADIIIFISPDIIIPVEIERYQNIEAGKKQLFNYQADLDKKYGILTDGFYWRFYTNNIFREFTLNQILEETEMFLEFWKEYIKPEFYYLLFFEPIGQLKLLKQDKLPVEQNRQMFFEDITKLIKSFKNKLQIEGYFDAEDLDRKTKSKMAIEITYAYIIQFILYKTLVDNSFGDFDKEFNAMVSKIHKCLKAKRYKEILGIIDGISAKISKNIYKPFAKEQELIREKLLELYRSVENKLSDVSPWLDIFVFIKKYTFANIENEIFGYIYENYLKELYEETKKGQYFTDPDMVNFMLQQVGFAPDKLKNRYADDKNSISLIDPSCGSGTFLYSAVNQIIKLFGNHSEEKSKQVEEIVNNNIFGLDIAEFPLYLAEMNIVMRMLPLIITEKYNNPIEKKIKVFLTKDSVAEFQDTGLRNTINDIDANGGQQTLSFKDLDLGYSSYVREASDLEEMKQSLENNKIPRRRFDYVIGNPPYVSYNECSKQNVKIFEFMRDGRAKLNNIYGVNLHSAPDKQKKYSPKPNLYAFFIAAGIALLKDAGKLCYIIPQTLLTAGDLDVIRYHLAKFTTIEKIITFSGKMFIGRGLKQNKPVATSSLIFVLKRAKPASLHKVQIINYKKPNHSIEKTLKNILDNKDINKKEILQTKLLQNIANWNFIKQDKKFLDFYEQYKKHSDDMRIYYDHLWAEQKFGSKFYFDGGGNIIENKITDSKIDAYEIFDYRSNDYTKFAISSENGKYCPKNAKITFPQGSQGIKVFQQQYKIIWRTRETPKFQFCDKEILLVSNQSLTISSNNKKEVLFLLSLLNSNSNKIIIEKNLLQEQERTFFVPIKAIKEFVRVPRITEDNQKIKKEIIRKTEEMLELEKPRLSDFVDFSKIMIQKFDSIAVQNHELILEKNKEKIKLPIKENKSLIQKILTEKYNQKTLKLEKQQINLSELKNLPVIDYEKQQKIKDYIDDLVFALYLNIGLDDLGINKASQIQTKLSKNKFYKLINKK